MYEVKTVIRPADDWFHPYHLELPQDPALGTTDAPCRDCGTALRNARHCRPGPERTIAFRIAEIAGGTAVAMTTVELGRLQSPQRACARVVEELRAVAGRA